MYSLEQLQQKNIKQLKEIGWQLNVLPEGDRRCRQNWIDAIVGVNPPLLQLLEVSPAAFVVEQVQPIIETVETPSAVEVEPVPTLPIESKFCRIVYPRPVQKPIAQAVENFPGVDPGVDVDRVQEPITPAVKTKKRAHEPIELALDEELPSEEEARSIVSQYFISTSLRKIRSAPPPARIFCPGERVRIIEVAAGFCNSQFCGSIGIVAQHNFYVSVWVELNGGGRKIVLCSPEKLELIELVARESAAKQEPIEIQRQEPIENSPGVEVDPVEESIVPAKNSPGVEVDPVEESIVPAKNFPGSRSKASIAHQLLELFQSTAHIIEDSPGVKTEATVSESAIAPAAKNPILGVTFSDRFLARYSPPQAQIIHFQSDADGQLSLLDFEVQSVDEPPDPDDFESLDAFREALARWDCEHNEVSPEHNEPLQVSLDSFCLWVPCPADWYEPAALLEPSSMLELSSTRKSFITSDFFIPTFDCLGDRSNKSDEPPDTGVFAKLPKPNPPSFPPATVGQVRAKLRPNSAQTQSKRIPNAYQTHTCCILVGSSIQPARSPPGGDAGF